MLSEVCLYLKNWFTFGRPKFFGKFKIENNVITSYNDGDMGIQTNQYYRVIGSVFNDGVYKHGEEAMTDEIFTGAVWLMAVPPDFLELVAEIDEWQEKYGGVDSSNMSPFQSESFGGYSYSKSSGGSASGSESSVPTWQAVFGDRLKRYKKI